MMSSGNQLLSTQNLLEVVEAHRPTHINHLIVKLTRLVNGQQDIIEAGKQPPSVMTAIIKFANILICSLDPLHLALPSSNQILASILVCRSRVVLKWERLRDHV